jgi:hypothetical protein
MIFHTVNIVYDNSFWIVLFEMNDENGYSVAREVIGTSEPTGSDLYLFFSHLDYNRLKYTNPSLRSLTRSFQYRIGYKKRQRQIKREKQRGDHKNTFTKAQAELKRQFLENKTEAKSVRRIMRMDKEEHKFRIKQQKRKEKHRGH